MLYYIVLNVYILCFLLFSSTIHMVGIYGLLEAHSINSCKFLISIQISITQ